MPQFDFSVFMGQIFWLLISFGMLYMGIYFIIFPMFNTIFDTRKKLIEIPLEKAEKITQDTQRLELEIEKKKLSKQKRDEEKLNAVYQEETLHLQEMMDKTDKSFSMALGKTVQKMNKDEMLVLKNANTFVQKTLKGIK